MDKDALIEGLHLVQRGLTQVISALGGDDVQGDDQSRREEREIAVLKQFDRPAGQGLTQMQASQAFRANGFDPRTMGGWAKQGRLLTRPDGLRYLTPAAQDWLRNRGVDVLYDIHVEALAQGHGIPDGPEESEEKA